MAPRVPVIAYPAAFGGALLLGRFIRSGDAGAGAGAGTVDPTGATDQNAVRQGGGSTDGATADGWDGWGDSGLQFPPGAGGVLPTPIGGPGGGGSGWWGFDDPGVPTPVYLTDPIGNPLPLPGQPLPGTNPTPSPTPSPSPSPTPTPSPAPAPAPAPSQWWPAYMSPPPAGATGWIRVAPGATIWRYQVSNGRITGRTTLTTPGGFSAYTDRGPTTYPWSGRGSYTLVRVMTGAYAMAQIAIPQGNVTYGRKT